MQNSSEFQYIAIDQLFESKTNPRKTFDQKKLEELAESIRSGGLIQPIVVRPKNNAFEIVAGARRFRAGQLAEQFSLPARIKELTDAQALEWQLVENSQREDVHPYEEAQGFQSLLDLPGYDVAALVEKSGKSASHIYARLSLLQLIPAVAEAFQQERITASHAALIARLPQEHQADAFDNCWRKDWQDKEAHLLPAKHLSAWIQTNLYLNLADAPFDREDPSLNPTAGACVTCPRRSGYNTSLFCDVQGDQCLDAPCYHGKVAAHLDREIAAHPGIVLIENGWRNPKEQRPGAVQLGHVRQIETVIDNPDAEPVMPCDAAKPAIIVYGKNVGATLTVCTDRECPMHDPETAARLAEEQAVNPVPVMEPAPIEETEEEAAEREREYAQRRREYEEEQQRREEERKQQARREHEAHEAERNRIAELHKARLATVDRIVANAPAMFTAIQLRTFLSALIHLDPYMFEDIAEQQVADDENNQQSAEEILGVLLASTPDDKLTRFALHLVLTSHAAIPRQGEFDILADAEAAFVPVPPKKGGKGKKTKAPTPIKAAKKPVAVSTPEKKDTTRKKAA
ncbi:ParB/RepB/Spo0J family partition protein [Granulicella sibirica]|uniref:Chromosome (Plasmid) partitioning protein ParB n=1 Tax=Granulicella sibirica TaxID=2479048 RepID=A0A4V1L5R4_9BACT|nr:ParB/RepB/Spo0J family partition protein [Granulicella sibirica]RXH56674.1 Chromosome (plasmid) partitioning protein ParB [Granulicella sibirica]